MRFSTVAAAASLGALSMVKAAPTDMDKRADDVNTLVLQFALTLEHLENYFYSSYLDKFDADAFASAGFEPWVRGRLSQIAEHEASHVALLAGALGASATVPCTYNFGEINDARTFVETAYIIEQVGSSAYLGAAPLITVPAYLGVAGSILVTEARHQGWQSSSGLRMEPWSSAYETALAPQFIYDIVAPYFVSCPAGAYALPFTAANATTFDVTDGTITYDGMADGQFAVLIQALDMKAFPVSGGKVEIPAVKGIAYLIPSSSGNVTELATSALAAPFIISTSFSSADTNPDPAFK